MNTNETTEINDLTVTTEQQIEIRGGDRTAGRFVQADTLVDLEPTTDVKGGAVKVYDAKTGAER